MCTRSVDQRPTLPQRRAASVSVAGAGIDPSQDGLSGISEICSQQPGTHSQAHPIFYWRSGQNQADCRVNSRPGGEAPPPGRWHPPTAGYRHSRRLDHRACRGRHAGASVLPLQPGRVLLGAGCGWCGRCKCWRLSWCWRIRYIVRGRRPNAWRWRFARCEIHARTRGRSLAQRVAPSLPDVAAAWRCSAPREPGHCPRVRWRRRSDSSATDPDLVTERLLLPSSSTGSGTAPPLGKRSKRGGAQGEAGSSAGGLFFAP